MSETPLPKRGLKITTILLASSLTVMAGAAITPATPQIKAAFADIPSIEFLTKLMVSLPALFIALGSLIIGQLIDRYGRLKFLNAGLVLYALAGTSATLLADPYQILVTRAGLGLAVACIMPVAASLIGDYFEGKEREGVTAMQGAAMALGGLVFVGTAGVLADIDWKYTFLVYGFSLVVLFFSVFSLDEPKIERNDDLQKGFFNGLTKIHWVLLLMGMITMVLFYMLPLQIPYLLQGLGVKESKMIGFAIMANTFGSIIVAASYKFLRRFLTLPGANGILYALMAVGFFTISSATNYTTVVIGLGISGLGLGLFIPNFSFWILEITPPSIRGKAVGLTSSAIFLGQFASPFSVQPFLEFGNTLQDVFLYASILLVLLSIFFWGLHFSGRRQ